MVPPKRISHDAMVAYFIETMKTRRKDSDYPPAAYAWLCIYTEFAGSAPQLWYSKSRGIVWG